MAVSRPQFINTVPEIIGFWSSEFITASHQPLYPSRTFILNRNKHPRYSYYSAKSVRTRQAILITQNIKRINAVIPTNLLYQGISLNTIDVRARQKRSRVNTSGMPMRIIHPVYSDIISPKLWTWSREGVHYWRPTSFLALTCGRRSGMLTDERH